MFSTNQKWSIFVVFMVMFSSSESFRLDTEKSLTAVRGGNISLPCNFSVHAHAMHAVYHVFWYKHNFSGAPDNDTVLVARDFLGVSGPVRGFERFSITKDYSLIIRNITVHDETTYSCLVLNTKKGRGYTDLRVVALAEPLEPIIEIIEPCTFTEQGGCIYHVNRPTIDKDTSENVILVCKLLNVRPLPILTWIRSDERLYGNATDQTHEKDGLFNISSQIKVSKSHVDHHYTCQAKGEAVNGTSSGDISFEDSATHVSNDRLPWKEVAMISVALLLVGVIVLIYYRIRGRLSCFLREYRDTKRWKADGTSTTVGYTGGSEPDRDRRGSNYWCSCKNCPVMQTDVESLCCRELTRCREIQTNGCIIGSKAFKDVCLNIPFIQWFLSLKCKDHQIPGNMGNESYRLAAYRLWSDYLHGYMGKGVRRPLPACVVTRVRQEFPEETGFYVGFKYGKRGEKECLLSEQ